jgi:hypothetical protein
VSPVNCLLFSWPELKSWQWLSFLLLQPWYVPEELQLLLMQVELLKWWLRQVRLLRGWLLLLHNFKHKRFFSYRSYK